MIQGAVVARVALMLDELDVSNRENDDSDQATATTVRKTSKNKVVRRKYRKA